MHLAANDRPQPEAVIDMGEAPMMLRVQNLWSISPKAATHRTGRITSMLRTASGAVQCSLMSLQTLGQICLPDLCSIAEKGMVEPFCNYPCFPHGQSKDISANRERDWRSTCTAPVTQMGKGGSFLLPDLLLRMGRYTNRNISTVDTQRT